MAQLSHEPITLSMAEDALQVINKARDPRAITPDLIASMVCEYMGVSREDLLGKKRNREIALARQYAIYICREMTNLSTTRIGAEFGGRDHSTVMHACDKVSELMDSDTDTRRTISAIRQKVPAAEFSPGRPHDIPGYPQASDLAAQGFQGLFPSFHSATTTTKRIYIL